MTKHVFIIYGEPATGKSKLAECLDEAMCEVYDNVYCLKDVIDISKKIGENSVACNFVITNNDNLVKDMITIFNEDLENCLVSVLHCEEKTIVRKPQPCNFHISEIPTYDKDIIELFKTKVEDVKSKWYIKENEIIRFHLPIDICTSFICRFGFSYDSTLKSHLEKLFDIQIISKTTSSEEDPFIMIDVAERE